MNKFLTIFVFLLCSFTTITTQAQRPKSHEIGFIYGSASFTTDYGQRNNFNSNVGGNVGMGIGIIFYLNFTDYRYRWNHPPNYWTEHFRIRAELSYMSANLNHFGKWINVRDKITGELSEGAKKLRAQHGKINLLNIGSQIEFHWVDIVDFGSRRISDLKWSPYISVGAFVDFYDPSIKSDYGSGDWRDPGVLFPKWDINDYPKAVRVDPDITMSATLGIGTRYKIGEYSDLLIESRWQYFFSNYVDGLDAQQDSANKFNDWLLWVHVGYVYYLD